MSQKSQRKASHKRRPFRSRHRPRGIVLLLVVSLITLFLLIGITFTVIAINYRTAAGMIAQNDQLGDNYEHELDTVLKMILRDSKSPPADNPVARNSLQFHSLLYDLYGVDGVAGTVQQESSSAILTTGFRSENPTSNGQVIHFTPSCGVCAPGKARRG